MNDESDNIVLTREALSPYWREAVAMAVLKRLLHRPLDPGLAWLRPEMVDGAAVFQDGGTWRCELVVDGGPGKGRLAPKAVARDREGAVTHLLAMMCDAVLAGTQAAPLEAEAVPDAAAPSPAAESPATPPVAAPLPDAVPVPAEPDAPGTFRYDGLSLPLPARVVRELREAGVDRINERYVRRRLDEIRRDVAGGAALTQEVVDALAPDARRGLLMVCTMAALAGIPRWPETGAMAA